MRCDSDARSRTSYRLSSSVTGSSVHAKRPVCTISVVCRKPPVGQTSSVSGSKIKDRNLDKGFGDSYTALRIAISLRNGSLQIRPLRYASNLFSSLRNAPNFFRADGKEQSTKYVTQSAAWPTEGSAHAGQPLHQGGPLANPITEMARGRTLTTFRALPWGTRSARSLAPLSQAPRSPGSSFARPVACSERSSRKPCARSASRLLNPSLARPCLERKLRATDAPGPVSGRHSVTSICDLLACTGMCVEGALLRQWARACLC